MQPSPIQRKYKVSLTSSEHQLTFEIEDSGIGVDPEFYSKITERFYRQQQGKGAGLGLALVNNIAQYHQGKISFVKS